MLLIRAERFFHIGGWRPLFSKKMVVAASLSYKIGSKYLLFGNIIGGVLTWSGYWIPLKLSFMLHVSSYVLRSYEFENAVLSLVMQGGSETSDSV